MWTSSVSPEAAAKLPTERHHQGAYDGPALVLGGAASLEEDMMMAMQLLAPAAPTRIGINSVPELVICDHLIGAHAQLMPEYYRHAIGRPKTHTYWQAKIPREVDVVWHNLHAGGSSGLLATKIAVAMGFAPVVLCGVPMQVSGYAPDYRKHEPQGGRILHLGHHPQKLETWREHWHTAKADGLLINVRSMSGWTKELLNG